jgi:hypothetical protein
VGLPMERLGSLLRSWEGEAPAEWG